jgi:hypothetical protein
VTTQLRLVEPPEPTTLPSRRTGARTARVAATGRARSRRTTRPARRAVTWGEWHLDASTRQVGRAGVAQARKALEAVVEQELSQAS